jgi:UDP-N-acetylmuramoylalanine--D-glutamate ligase
LELVAESDSGVRYVNDSIATTPESTIVAVNAFRQPIHIILGGYDKKVDFNDMAAAITVSNVKKAYLIGSTAGAIEAALVQSGFNGEIILAGTLTRAVESASVAAVSDSVILLSPGCASYDQFKNFTERGIVFRQLAGKMISKVTNPTLESFADVA